MASNDARLAAAAQSLGRLLAAKPQAGQINVRWATVTAVNTGPPKTVDLLMGGTAIPAVLYTASYTPTVADTVRVEILGSVPFVTDKVAT